MDNGLFCVILDSQKGWIISYPVDSFHNKIHCPNGSLACLCTVLAGSAAASQLIKDWIQGKFQEGY